MTETLHANIFFLIASVGVVVFILLVCIALYHVIKVIRSVRRIIERIEAGSEAVASDLSELRTTFHPKRLFSFIKTLTGFVPRRGRSRTESDDDA